MSAPAVPDALPARLRQALLERARRAIEAAVRDGHRHAELPATGEARLGERRGAFVTIRSRGELRGCIGYVEADGPLEQTVVRAAVAAATADARFPPVTAAELPELRLEVSVLTVPVPIRPADVEIGRHGLIVEQAARRGLLLPQVPAEQGWDREQFLDGTCRKAGLPDGAWRDPAARLLGFEAEVFGDDG